MTLSHAKPISDWLGWIFVGLGSVVPVLQSLDGSMMQSLTAAAASATPVRRQACGRIEMADPSLLILW